MSKKNKGGNKQSKKTQTAVNNEKKTQQQLAATAENKTPNKENEKLENKPQASTKQEKSIPTPPPAPEKEAEQVEFTIEKPGEGKNIPRVNEGAEKQIPDDMAKGLQQALAHGSVDRLSADGRVMLLNLTHKVFVEENRTGFAVPVAVQQKMNYVVQVGVVTQLADAAVNGDDAFAIVMKSAAYPALAEVAKELKVQLPSIKAIEAFTSPEIKKQGNIAIPAGKGSGTKVSKEAAEQLKHDKEVQENKPELDPTKITSEEDLKKALTYLLTVKDKSIGRMLVDVVDFMRNYRMTEAAKAENSTEAMEKLDARTTAAWLDDIFHYATPSFLLSGIGKGMSLTVDATGSPVRAFTILYESIKAGSKEEQIPWDDQSIADAVTCIIRWVTLISLDADKKNLAALGDPNKYDTQTKEIAEKYKESIAHMEKRLDTIVNPPADFVTTFLDKFHAHDKHAVTLYGQIRNLYYPQTMTEEGKKAQYKNLESNIAQRVGIIFNLFRHGNKVDGYSADNLTDLETYTDDELKAEKKAELEAKKANSEKSEPSKK